MTDQIQPLGPAGAQPPKPPTPGKTEEERSFKQILQSSIEQVNQLQLDADLSLEKLLKNEAKPEEVMVAFKKAQVAFETLLQIRNKLVDAFEEIQRMRI